MRYPILSSFWKYILYYCLRWYTVNGLGFPCRKMLRNCVTHKWLLVKAKTHRITEVAHWTKFFRLAPKILEGLISFPSFRIYWSIFYELSCMYKFPEIVFLSQFRALWDWVSQTQRQKQNKTKIKDTFFTTNILPHAHLAEQTCDAWLEEHVIFHLYNLV